MPFTLLLWLLAALPLLDQGQAAPSDPTCDFQAQQDALMSFHYASGGPTWSYPRVTQVANACSARGMFNTTCTPWGNNTNSCITTDIFNDRIALPSYCCWRGVFCCLSASQCNYGYDKSCNNTEPNFADCAVGTVSQLSLRRFNLTGPFPGMVTALSNLSCNLRKVELQYNQITSSIPAAITQLTALKQLVVGYNGLSGTMPPELGTMDLLQLDVQLNHLSGKLPDDLCNGTSNSNLMDLIVSHNNFSGPWNIMNCNKLIFIDAQNNSLSGPFPDLTGYTQLHIMKMGRNHLQGTIPPSIYNAPLQTLFSYPSNNLVGPIPEQLGSLIYLQEIDLSSNNLSSTIPPSLFTRLGALEVLNLANNSLSGTIPDGIKEAKALTSIQFQNNSLYGTIPEQMAIFAQPGISVDLSMNGLSCCALSDPTFLPIDASWRGNKSSPGYVYVFYRPRLPSFLEQSAIYYYPPTLESIDGDFTALKHMRCPALKKAGTADDASSLLSWRIDPEYYLYSGCICDQGYRTEFYNNWNPGVNMGVRVRCVEEQAPSNSWFDDNPWIIAVIVLLSLALLLWMAYNWLYRRRGRPVVIQTMLNMRKRVKGEPMGGLISVVTTDIEGYSNLIKSNPSLMTKALNLHNNVIRKARWNNFGYTVEQEGDSYSLVFYEAMDAVMFCLQTQQALMRQPWPEGLFNDQPLLPPKKSKTSAGSQFLANITQSWMTRQIMKLDMSHAGSGGSTTAPLEGSQNPQPGQGQAQPPPQAPLSGFLPHKRDSCAPKPIFNGLRVRMGIATGVVAPGTPARGSWVMELAKVVSDAGSGGQILMDLPTFLAIKERQEELGAVDHSGLNYAKLNSIRPPWYLCWTKKRDFSEEVVTLDMGEYIHSVTKTLPAILEAGPGPLALAQGNLSGRMDQPPTAKSHASQPATFGPGGAGAAGGHGDGHLRLKLYQMLPPSLVGRARVFGNKLALKEEYVCYDLPYFSAPGTLDAPIGLVESNITLPPVTMVFCIVDGGKQFALRYRTAAKQVHNTIAQCIRNTLRQVPGGYLCRLQDGELKYMVCFHNAKSAVVWSLVLQEVLMYTDWSDTVLKWDKFREEKDGDGKLLFRGPRMKMGICEGPPKSILPDHLGRADYHGYSINQSARFMDAGAHGGQVVCEESLAIAVIQSFQQGDYELPQPRASLSEAPSLPAPLPDDVARGSGGSGDRDSGSNRDRRSPALSSADATNASVQAAAAGQVQAPNALPAGTALRSMTMRSNVGFTPMDVVVESDAESRASPELGTRTAAMAAAAATPGPSSAEDRRNAVVSQPAKLPSQGGPSTPASLTSPAGAETGSKSTVSGVKQSGKSVFFLIGGKKKKDAEDSVPSSPALHVAEDDLEAPPSAPRGGGGGGSFFKNVSPFAAAAHEGVEGEEGEGEGAEEASSLNGSEGRDTADRHCPSSPSNADPVDVVLEPVRQLVTVASMDGSPQVVLAMPPEAHIPDTADSDQQPPAATRPGDTGPPPIDGSASGGADTSGRSRQSSSVVGRLDSIPSPTIHSISSSTTPFLTMPSIIKNAPGMHGLGFNASTASSLPGGPAGEVEALPQPQGAEEGAGAAQGSASGSGAGPSEQNKAAADSATPTGAARRSVGFRPPPLTLPQEDHAPHPASHPTSPEPPPFKTHVFAYRIGVYKFKGSPDEINLCTLYLEPWHNRKELIPAEPPKGKGGRVREASGLVIDSHVELSNIAVKYRMRFEVLHGPGNTTRSAMGGRRLKSIMTMGHTSAGPETPGTRSTRLANIFRSGASVTARNLLRNKSGNSQGSGGSQTHSHDPESGTDSPRSPAVRARSWLRTLSGNKVVTPSTSTAQTHGVHGTATAAIANAAGGKGARKPPALETITSGHLDDVAPTPGQLRKPGLLGGRDPDVGGFPGKSAMSLPVMGRGPGLGTRVLPTLRPITSEPDIDALQPGPAAATATLKTQQPQLQTAAGGTAGPQGSGGTKAQAATASGQHAELSPDGVVVQIREEQK